MVQAWTLLCEDVVLGAETAFLAPWRYLRQPAGDSRIQKVEEIWPLIRSSHWHNYPRAAHIRTYVIGDGKSPSAKHLLNIRYLLLPLLSSSFLLKNKRDWCDDRVKLLPALTTDDFCSKHPCRGFQGKTRFGTWRGVQVSSELGSSLSEVQDEASRGEVVSAARIPRENLSP